MKTILLSFFIFQACNSGKTSSTEDLDNDGVLAADDCNDNDASIFPEAEELCDGIDNDCDGIVDNDLLTTFYIDSDEDGFGTDDNTIEACTAQAGIAEIGGDCDDSDASIYPNAEEICDEIDNNCDGEIDEGLLLSLYLDADFDGYGSVERLVCANAEGLSENGEDCDDSNSTVNPLAEEICDGIDNNCDDIIDDDAIDLQTWYADEDNDGYGNIEITTSSCNQPENYVANSSDCDDIDSDIHPMADELCDDQDNDCDN